MFTRSKERPISSLPAEEDSVETDAHTPVNDDGEMSAGDDASTVDAQSDPTTRNAELLPAAADDDGAVLRVQRTAIGMGVAIVVALGALVGRLGFEVNRDDRVSGERALFEQTARQGAIDLTTIDWRQAEDDVKRILNTATGTFHSDFAQRSQPFIDVIKESKSVTTGTVTASGLESSTNDEAQVMVAVSVRTSSVGGPESNPRAWRMRIAVQKVDGDVKVSNVEFVP